MNTVKTNKGTILPLISLKGKDYLQVAHRIVWFNEETPNFGTSVNFLKLEDDQTVAQVTVTVLSPEGKVLRQASDVKRETKADFSDHTEKAVTGALGRALAQLGFGTAYAIADLDEGTRLADSPVTNTKGPQAKAQEAASTPPPAPLTAKPVASAPSGSFRKANGKPTPAVTTTPAGATEEWDS